MRFQFFWDEPYTSVVSFFYQFASTLTALAFALTLAIIARRRLGRARSLAQPVDSGIDGASFASAILTAGNAQGWTIVRAKGSLANFSDPARLELRLSETVAGGQSVEALAIAAHQAGHALVDSRNQRLSRVRIFVIFGAKLASEVAWLTLLAGALMLSPFLTDRGSLLLAASVFAWLTLQKWEIEANRQALLTIHEASLDASWTDLDKEAFARALEATRWADLAATLPIPLSRKVM